MLKPFADPTSHSSLARFSLDDAAARVAGTRKNKKNSYRVSVLCMPHGERVAVQQKVQYAVLGCKMPMSSHVQVFVDSPLLGIADEGFNGLHAWRYEADMHVRLLVLAEALAGGVTHARLVRQQLQRWGLPFQVVYADGGGAWMQRVCDSVLHGWQRFEAQNALLNEQKQAEAELPTTVRSAGSGWQAWCDCCLDPASERALFALRNR